MARVTLPSFIKSISGQVGNICFRTYASGKTGVYPVQKQQRSKPVTKAETRARDLFKERVKRVNNIMRDDPFITRKKAWEIVKQMPS